MNPAQESREACVKRDASKENFWRKTMAEACSSGQSVQEFCQQRGLKPHQFYGWRRELRLRDGEAADRSGFVELVRPAAVGNGAGVSIRIDERLSIVLQRGFDREVLMAALTCLSEAGRPAVAAEAGKA
jgi:transposase-like protein